MLIPQNYIALQILPSARVKVYPTLDKSKTITNCWQLVHYMVVTCTVWVPPWRLSNAWLFFKGICKVELSLITPPVRFEQSQKRVLCINKQTRSLTAVLASFNVLFSARCPWHSASSGHSHIWYTSSLPHVASRLPLFCIIWCLSTLKRWNISQAFCSISQLTGRYSHT